MNFPVLAPMTLRLKLMRYLTLSLLLMAIALQSGCQTLDVKNNVVRSSRHPYLEVKVSPDYKYFGHFDYIDTRWNITKTRKHSIACDSFLFIPSTLKKGISQVYVYVKIEKNLDSFFVQPFLKSSIDVLDWELKILGWYDFEVASRIVFPSGVQDGQLQKMAEEGIMLPVGVIKVEAARVVRRNKVIRVIYGEDLATSGLNYDQWKDIKSLTKEQKAYINEATQRAMSAFEILASD